MAETETIHATAVAIGEHGVLIIGPSGSGKSDLALRLIDRGAKLICDDRIILRKTAHEIIAEPAPNIAGKMEIRGLGIFHFEHVNSASVALIIDLDADPVRFPEPHQSREILGAAVPTLPLSAFEASAPIKVELALQKETMHKDEDE